MVTITIDNVGTDTDEDDGHDDANDADNDDDGDGDGDGNSVSPAACEVVRLIIVENKYQFIGQKQYSEPWIL